MSDILRARRVLAGTGWRACGASGRQLEPSDLLELQELAIGDRHFAWERTEQTPDYYAKLLEFRISHYERYGFGVHGVWQAGHLVGQCGLQVLDASDDLVELVMFLGRAYRGQGLGACLGSHLIRGACEAGLTAVYGVVRPENEGGRGLMLKLGAKKVGHRHHFGEEADLFAIAIGGGGSNADMPCGSV